MTLEKLTITYQVGVKDPISQKATAEWSGKIQALFNPTELSFSRKLEWKPRDPAASPRPVGLECVHREPEKLSVQFFLDTYEGASGGSQPSLLKRMLPSRPGPSSTSVVPYLVELEALAALDPELHEPPLCRLRWGKQSLFTGVLESTTRKLVLFLEDGTPVRATVDCSFLEAAEVFNVEGELHSPDVAKKYTLQRGDTLSLVAARLYNDPSRWRAIAEANGIDDPRRLMPGRVILIPKVS